MKLHLSIILLCIIHAPIYSMETNNQDEAISPPGSLLESSGAGLYRYLGKLIGSKAVQYDLAGLGSNQERQKTHTIQQKFYEYLGSDSNETETKQFLTRLQAINSTAIELAAQLSKLSDDTLVIDANNIRQTEDLLSKAELLTELHDNTFLAPEMVRVLNNITTNVRTKATHYYQVGQTKHRRSGILRSQDSASSIQSNNRLSASSREKTMPHLGAMQDKPDHVDTDDSDRDSTESIPSHLLALHGQERRDNDSNDDW